ncbi:DUF58 domain-containing protein, partial [Schnuerera sp.]|uniref:DUF58 domain-containing protein n=1 Tax=Schnuerera sp. TaxID=2794844 RepID=UPI002C6F3D4A
MLWLFITLVALIFGFNKLSMKYGLKNLKYRRTLSKNMIEIGEFFEVNTVIENKKPFPVTYLRITERFPTVLDYSGNVDKEKIGDYFEFTTTLFVMPYQRVKRIYSFFGNKRGCFIFRNVDLKVGDFIGLNTSSITENYLHELVVLPKPLDLDKNLVLYGSYYGQISVKRWIIDDPLMTVGIREYTGNEPEKHIHWPSSLKYGNLMVKNFDFTTEHSVNIILNVESAKPFWSNIEKDEIETCISLCRGIVEELEQNNIPYSFVNNSYGGYKIDDIYSNNYEYVLNSLGRVSYGVAVEFETLINEIVNKRNSFTTFIIITPRIFNSYIEPLEKLKTNNNKLILISLD